MKQDDRVQQFYQLSEKACQTPTGSEKSSTRPAKFNFARFAKKPEKAKGQLGVQDMADSFNVTQQPAAALLFHAH